MVIALNEADCWRISTGSDSGTKAPIAQEVLNSSLEQNLKHYYPITLPIPSFISLNYAIIILYWGSSLHLTFNIF